MSKIEELYKKIDKEFTDYKYNGMEDDTRTLLNYDSSLEALITAADNIAVRSRLLQGLKDLIETYEDETPLERETIVTLLRSESVLDYAVKVYNDADIIPQPIDLRDPEGLITLMEQTADRISDVSKQILDNAKKLDEMYGKG